MGFMVTVCTPESAGRQILLVLLDAKKLNVQAVHNRSALCLPGITASALGLNHFFCFCFLSEANSSNDDGLSHEAS